MKTVRTRFAPSPTGSLHLGSARTALYNWLFARHAGGTFILRIEDTDQARSTPESVAAIMRAMQWLELDHDEGPFFQTQRFPRYREVIEHWLHMGLAYRCTCSKDRLDELRAHQMANQLKPRYDGHCRDREIPAHHPEPYVVRFKMPVTGQVVVDDVIHGSVVFDNQELDDLIIQRSDGTPTYNFTVSVDDADMAITDVIRGDDHLSNTPKQIHMLQALGAPIPRYVHLTMILGPDGKKLSKRHGAVDVHAYAEQGFLPHALINTLVRLGWSHGDTEIFSREELVSYFDLSHLSASAAALNPEKAVWLNQHYLKSLPFETILPHIRAYLATQGDAHWEHQAPALQDVYALQATRIKTLHMFWEKSRFFYQRLAWDPAWGTADRVAIWQHAHQAFTAAPDWTPETLHQIVNHLAEATGGGLGAVAQPLRIALTYGTVSPPLDQTIALLGRTETLARLAAAIAAADHR